MLHTLGIHLSIESQWINLALNLALELLNTMHLAVLLSQSGHNFESNCMHVYLKASGPLILYSNILRPLL